MTALELPDLTFAFLNSVIDVSLISFASDGGLFVFFFFARRFFEPQLLFLARFPFLSHRGPDDSGTFLSQDKSNGLAHTRLSILDTSDAGHQPMFSPDRNLALVFNGEIYNYKELRIDLKTMVILFVPFQPPKYF